MLTVMRVYVNVLHLSPPNCSSCRYEQFFNYISKLLSSVKYVDMVTEFIFLPYSVSVTYLM